MAIVRFSREADQAKKMAGFVNVQFTTWLQMRVERAMLGRVMSVLMFSAVGLVPVSYAISGVVAQWSLP